MRIDRLRAVVASLCVVVAGISHASVVIVGTRVVYPSDARDVSIRLNNSGASPALIQSWIDDGDAKAAPEAIDVPFSLSPPVFRMDPGKSQVMRLVYTGEPQSNKRESLFWLNVLEVPPKPSDTGATNTLQFAVRSRIKIFYRPTSLQGDPAAAAVSLQWKYWREGSALKATATNASGFHVSLAEVRLVEGESALSSSMTGMVAPQSELNFQFDRAFDAGAAPTALKLKFVDDYGAFRDLEVPIVLDNTPQKSKSP
jgi:P pilus assembly chaperone PapD